MNTYTKEERIQIMRWLHQGNTRNETRQLFIAAFEDRPAPSLSTITRIQNQFDETGSVMNCRCQNRREIRHGNINELRDLMICAIAEQDNSKSARDISEEVGVPKSTVKWVLRRHGYRSFKISVGHQLLPRDHISRMVFCENMLERINADEMFLSSICFGDESSFPLLGRHNPSVVRFWARNNPRRRTDYRTQYPQKLNVWAGMIGNHVLGPFFIAGNLTAQVYLDLLQNDIVPAIQELPDIDFNQIWFQQDGCPAHNAAIVRNYLEAVFAGRIIANWGTIHWAARSPDLAINDFFLWGFIKQKVYNHQRCENLEELRLKIINAFRLVTPDLLLNARRSFYDRLGYCLANAGENFEHLI